MRFAEFDYICAMIFDEDIRSACDVMRRGGVILYPTDTVWGIGCDATCSAAVRRIFDIKRRADGKALITLLADAGDLSRYVADVPQTALDLIDVAVEPLTIIYDRGLTPPLASELPAADGSVAIRITRERYSAALCRAMRRPVVSTSANVSGCPSPEVFSQISPEIVGAVDYVAHFRREEPAGSGRKPSEIIKVGGDASVKIIRR